MAVHGSHGRVLKNDRRAWPALAAALTIPLAVGQAATTHLQVVISWSVQTLLFGVLLAQVARMAKEPSLPEATRRFWRILRLTCLISMATDGYPLAVSLGSRGADGAVPGLVHAICGSLALLNLVWACLSFRWKGDSRRRHVRRWLDAATLMVAGLGTLWYFESGPLLGEHVGLVTVATLILLDAFAIVAVLAFLQPMLSDIRPIVRGTGLMAVGAVISGVVTEGLLPLALGTPWLRLLLVVRVAPAALAVVAMRHQRSRLHAVAGPAGRNRKLVSRLPYAAVLVTYVLMGLALALSHADLRTWGMFTAACGVTGLVVVRQTSAMSDNTRLVRDLTASVNRADELAAELHQHAFYDDLTGLPNRMLFSDRLEHALVSRARSHADIAVMVVDLDDFKLVNDRCGHAEGDRVLREAAARLTHSLRAGDTVARLGGDEFAILVNGGDAEAVAAVASRIVDAFAAPFAVQDSTAELGVSVGITRTGDAFDVDGATLLRHADIAMYVAKSGGKRRYEEFVPTMLDNLVTRHDTKQALTRAIADEELVVHYQPIVDAVDGQVRGVEALVRWMRPGHGMVPPLEFLGLAEQVGLIPEIDHFVLRQACRQVQQWNGHRALGDKFSVHVNMSAMTLAAADVVDVVASALRDSGLPAHFLTVELTESALMADPPAVIARMHALKQTGVRLAIDDFGTGYSSLAYLRDLPVDTVKVDKSFVDRIVGEEIDLELVRTIVTLAGRLGLDTVAEGVEGQEQAALLSAIGCARMQGFLFSRPLPAEQVESTGERVGRASSWLSKASVVTSAHARPQLAPLPTVPEIATAAPIATLPAIPAPR